MTPLLASRLWLLDRRIDLQHLWRALRGSGGARRMRAQAGRVAVAVLLALGLWQLGGGLWLYGKAWLAQVLIEDAWQRNRAAGHAQARPWDWADTTPVARLIFPAQQAAYVVLSGEAGRVLAFGPGHRPDSPLPGTAGNSVISGHRDTHFRVLQRLQAGDLLEVEALDGHLRRYRVADMQIVDHRDLRVLADRGFDELTLVTCWPFDAIVPGGPLRYVVKAAAVDAS
ncbi:MAG: class GN sortase [Burkholderiaceae bacterium]